MNNLKTPKILAIGAILAVIATASLFVFELTAVLLTAYIFAIIGIVMFTFGNTFFLAYVSKANYPWSASFPITLGRYLFTQIIMSAILVAVEKLADWSIHTGLFVFIHIALLGIFSIYLILQKGGAEIIEEIEERMQETQAKYIDLRSLQMDVESLKERVPAQAKEIQSVADALRYSLPGTQSKHTSISEHEDKIKDSVIMLEQAADNSDSAKVSELCVALLRLIKDRNNRVKLAK